MKKREMFLLAGTIVLIFFITYFPHYTNPFPSHIDEWKSITETLKLKSGTISKTHLSLEIGFYYFLSWISNFVDLVLFYKYLPALWVALTALLLFFLMYNFTRNFFIAIFSSIFFASIKSNTNLTGLWFFTPLTFVIPFIYLYIFLINKSIVENKPQLMLPSFFIMCFVVISHPLSVLFFIPVLAIFLACKPKFVKDNWKILSFFLLIPVLGLIFYSKVLQISLFVAFKEILTQLVFKKGWGVLELNNSFFEIYSFIGYVLAICGFIIIFLNKSYRKKYLLFELWSLFLFISIMFYKLYGISFFSPFQRNMYYFALSLPVLSSLGLYEIRLFFRNFLNEYINPKKRKTMHLILDFIIIVTVILFTFHSYAKIPPHLRLYKIEVEDYELLKFLSGLPKTGRVLAPIEISDAVYPISGFEPVGTIFFYGNRKAVEDFFDVSSSCKEKKNIIKTYKVKYIISFEKLPCKWKQIYLNNNKRIYEVS